MSCCSTPRPVLIRSLNEALARLEQAQRSGCPVVLECPVDVVAGWGVPAALTLLRQAEAAFPRAVAGCILDCGDYAGLAQAALTQGARQVRLAPGCPARPALEDLARQSGARLLP